LEEARKTAEALRVKQQQMLIDDTRNLNQAISKQIEQEVFAIARNVLSDMATTSLEERLGEVFTRRLKQLDGPAKEQLAQAIKTASDPVVVRSAFDLPADQQAVIKNALNETFSVEVKVRFETAPDLISGIELTTNGQKLAWSIADYLVSLEKNVNEILNKQAKPEPAHEIQSPPKAK
jgi:F-type H+-transporting ATPase subunit b